MPDPWEEVLGGGTTTGGEEKEPPITVIGSNLWNIDGTFYGQLQQVAPTITVKQGGKDVTIPNPFFKKWGIKPGSLVIRTQDGGFKAFKGGTYQNEARVAMNISPDGRVASGTRQLTGDGTTGSYSGTKESQSQSEAAAAALQASRQAFEAEQNRIAREEARRATLISTATSLLNSRLNREESKRKAALEIAGTDPFRFLASVHQKDVEGGPTPYDVFKQTLAPTETPNINFSGSLSDLESGVGKLLQMQNPTQGPAIPFAPPTPTGMAGGGMLDNTGVQFGGTGVGVLVGDGTMNGDEEVVIRRPNGDTEVVPLVGRAAQGAVLSSQNLMEPKNLNLTVLPQLFSTLRSDLGGRMGYAAEADPNPARFGQTFGAVRGPISLERGLLEAQVSPEESARISQLIGFLPNPRTAAQFLRNLLPAEQTAVLSAYKLAGYQPDDVNALIESAVIRGPERRGALLA